jgi:hypothetical protein
MQDKACNRSSEGLLCKKLILVDSRCLHLITASNPGFHPGNRGSIPLGDAMFSRPHLLTARKLGSQPKNEGSIPFGDASFFGE